MSPETSPERKRLSKGFRKHIRSEKAEERRSQPLAQPIGREERITRFAIPSWEKMEGIIKLRMHNNPNLYTLSFKHRGILREFYDARYAIATGGDRTLYEEFFKTHNENEELLVLLTPHFELIRDTISPPRPKR